MERMYERVAARHRVPTLLDLVEEPLDQIASPVQIWTEAECVIAIASGLECSPMRHAR
jgi:hypothetical protein